MELLIEHFEKVLVYVGTLAKMFLEVMGILTITGGIILNFPDIIRLCHHPSTHIYSRVRINVARSLALALEFQLGADIVATTISATYGNLVTHIPHISTDY